jgi:hypothetical protein
MAVKIPDVGSFICVKWVDICSFVNADLKEVDVAECVSYGVLRSKDSDYIVLATSEFLDDSTGDFLSIPKGCIKEIALCQR